MKIIKVPFFWGASGVKTILADRAMLITDFFLGTTTPFLVQLSIWSALFSDGVPKSNLSYSQTLFYYAFALILGRLNNGYEVISHLSQQIRTGKLEASIVKPVPYPLQRFYVFMGESSLYFIPLIIAMLIYSYIAPDPNHIVIDSIWVAKALILVAASQALCFTLSFCIGALSFWVIESSILLSATLVCSAMLGGLLLPPEFWPNWISPLMTQNPFYFLIAAPAQILIQSSSADFPTLLAQCIAYIITFSFIGRLAWQQGLKSYSGAGG